MYDGASEPEPQPGETGSSATITLQIIIDCYPSLLFGRGGAGDPVDAVRAAVDAAVAELPMMVAELSDRLMEQFPVRMYLADDEEEDLDY